MIKKVKLEFFFPEIIFFLVIDIICMRLKEKIQVFLGLLSTFLLNNAILAIC